jgi:hypothetical protein
VRAMLVITLNLPLRVGAMIPIRGATRKRADWRFAIRDLMKADDRQPQDLRGIARL